ncbi:hypothetical protein GCM10010168_27450 [Actinoplanes ianthinogenes]|uniref:Uncharacterized protein n=1 Tax=Actinoplanes ianthinogenes TaxID=122358 RepID=A0ABM7LKU5_9ACTN|nr:hypothetical protein [Actinoplanes ianthinogenes]BCJ39886.1 hypothetical protein Aiant_05430 [Actinoplanes ianthinogenes]GGR08790.1 hypothetical protein GCM10010168_27450 [Actinoplanes ianthinogenes]
MTKPEHPATEHSTALTGIPARCPALRAVRDHVNLDLLRQRILIPH